MYNYSINLNYINSSESQIDTTYRKVQEELAEISLINGLMGGVEITNHSNTTYTNDADEDDDEDDDDDAFSDFM